MCVLSCSPLYTVEDRKIHFLNIFFFFFILLFDYVAVSRKVTPLKIEEQYAMDNRAFNSAHIFANPSMDSRTAPRHCLLETEARVARIKNALAPNNFQGRKQWLCIEE